MTRIADYRVGPGAPEGVTEETLAYPIDDVTLAERVVRVALAPNLTLVLHPSTLDAPLVFARLDVHDEATALPDWLYPDTDAHGFYAAWRESARVVWAGMPSVEVHVFARGAITPTWWLLQYCGGDCDTFIENPYPGPLAFRGFAWGAKARVICVADAAETPVSFGWLLVHELAHVAYACAPFCRYVFAAEKLNRGIPAELDERYDDAAHEADPEERSANAAATAAFGGACYDRLWWRRRLGEVRMTLTTRVPAGVPAVSILAGAYQAPDNAGVDATSSDEA